MKQKGTNNTPRRESKCQGRDRNQLSGRNSKGEEVANTSASANSTHNPINTDAVSLAGSAEPGRKMIIKINKQKVAWTSRVRGGWGEAGGMGMLGGTFPRGDVVEGLLYPPLLPDAVNEERLNHGIFIAGVQDAERGLVALQDKLQGGVATNARLPCGADRAKVAVTQLELLKPSKLQLQCQSIHWG